MVRRGFLVMILLLLISILGCKGTFFFGIFAIMAKILCPRIKNKRDYSYLCHVISTELEYRIRQCFQYEPTPEQVQAMKVFCEFVTEGRPQSAMILRGSAGTGKTSLAGAFVRTLAELRMKVVLLAPTGRAI